jgi:hypothetical protein
VRLTNHSHAVKVKNYWNCTSTPLNTFMACTEKSLHLPLLTCALLRNDVYICNTSGNARFKNAGSFHATVF